MNSILDSILKFLDKAKHYVSFVAVCETFKIPEDKREYILSKLESDGYIDVRKTKDSVDLRISDHGRVFINETGYSIEEEIALNKTILKTRNRQINFVYKTLTVVLSLTTVAFSLVSIKKEAKIDKLETIISNLNQENQKKQNINKTISETHFFSSSSAKDTFLLKMTGESVLSSKIEFKIISPDGFEIYNKVFESNELIGYGLIEIKEPTIDDEENYILKRFYTFFNDSNFASPAISKDVEFDPDYYDHEYFNLIKDQDNSKSFVYLLGEENSIRIAYIKNLHKVVEYWKCC